MYQNDQKFRYYLEEMFSTLWNKKMCSSNISIIKTCNSYKYKGELVSKQSTGFTTFLMLLLTHNLGICKKKMRNDNTPPLSSGGQITLPKLMKFAN